MKESRGFKYKEKNLYVFLNIPTPREMYVSEDAIRDLSTTGT